MGTFVCTRWLFMRLLSIFILTSSESHAFFVITMLETQPLHSLVGRGPSMRPLSFSSLSFLMVAALNWTGMGLFP